jgi:hypothetical protein
MRTNVLPILEQFGVDLVLTGHSHSYERSVLLDGHYGHSSTLTAEMVLDGGSGRESETGAYIKPALVPATNAGAVYTVAGSSGKTQPGLFNHPAMFISLEVLGSMVIDVDGYRLDATFLDNSGAQRDSFTIVKVVDPNPNNPPTVSITGPADGVLFNAPIDIAISASAEDDDGTVARVDFFAGSALIGADVTAPFEYTWQAAPAGTHVLTAAAIDDDGARGTSSPVSVTVVSSTVLTTLSLQNGSDGYSGMTDAPLRRNKPDTNFGNLTKLLLDGQPDISSVMRWDLSQIPTTATITQARLRLQVIDPSNASYSIYALLRPFEESTVTWLRATSQANWQQGGANGSSDRETIAIGSLLATTAGTYTITLNAAGISKVQSWVADPTTNHGLILLDYVPSDRLSMHSSEAATVSVRPTLIVSYE